MARTAPMIIWLNGDLSAAAEGKAAELDALYNKEKLAALVTSGGKET